MIAALAFPVILSAILSSASFAHAPAPACAGPMVRQEDGDKLEELMKDMKKHLKGAKKTVGDEGKKDECAKHFTDLGDDAAECKKCPPETADTEDKKKEYSEMMDKVTAASKDGAKAARDGKTDDAKAAIKEIEKLMKEGHKKFTK